MRLQWKQRVDLNECDGLDSEGFDADSGGGSDGGSDGGGVLSPDDGGKRLLSTPSRIQRSEADGRLRGFGEHRRHY